MKVLFVCLGNICRSPMAEALFRHHVARAGLTKSFEADSAGTGDWHVGEPPDPRMLATAEARGIPMRHAARQLQPDDFRQFDYVVCMDERNHAHALRLQPAEGSAARLVRMRDFDPNGSGEVPDPYFGGQEGFDHVFDMLDRCTRGFLAHLQHTHTG